MKTIRINRKKWVRGNIDDSYLWNPEIQQGCCLGHLIHQKARCSWNKLSRKSMPENYYHEDTYNDLVRGGCDSVFSQAAMSINDEVYEDEGVRESELIKLFKKNGYKLEFYN